MGVNAWGTTAAEERAGQPLAGRLRREAPDDARDIDGEAGDGLGDASDTDGELHDDELGAENGEDFLADDVGVGGAGASAEKAAIGPGR